MTALSGVTGTPGDALLTPSVSSETAQITTLAADGAKNFLIVNVPDVGLIPFMTAEHPTDAAAATADSHFYDSELNMQLAGLSLPAGTALHEFDLYDFNTTNSRRRNCPGVHEHDGALLQRRAGFCGLNNGMQHRQRQ